MKFILPHFYGTHPAADVSYATGENVFLRNIPMKKRKGDAL
jgi:hypothetical protein